MTAKSIVWLASYPKSGNTWTRAFLNNYILNPEKPIPINEMHRFTVSDSTAKFYEKVLGRSPVGMDETTLVRARARVLGAIAANGADINFVKTHNVNDKAFGQVLIPANLTRLAVYIVRNPLGIVPSYARHFGLDIDKTIYTIAHPANTSLTSERNVKEFLGNWSTHVDSWTRSRAFPVHVMRYEDMKADPAAAFGKLVKRIGLDLDPARLDRAIEFSSFKELRRQEETYGFIERSDRGASFFHSGETEAWKTELTEAQVAQVRKDHGKVMRRYGYF